MSALPASGSRFDALFQGLADPYVRVTMDGRIVETNSAYRDMLGYDDAELQAMTYRDLTPVRWHALEARIVEEQINLRNYSEVYEKEYRRKDGTVFPVELRTYLILRRSRPVGMWAIVRDISERKRTEEALRRSELRFRTLADEAPVGIFETNARGETVYANRAAKATAGMGTHQAAGRQWQAALHPDDRERVVRATSEAVGAGSPYGLEYRFRHQDGQTRLVRTNAMPLRSANGEVIGFIGAMLDITDHRALEAQLQESLRLAALGTLVAGIAHEVNNPLAALLMSIGLVSGEIRRIQHALATQAEIDRGTLAKILDLTRESLGRAEEEADQIARIVKDLNIVGRPDAPRSRVSLAGVVDKAMHWLDASLGNKITIRAESAEVQEIFGSEGQIAQVIVNLVANAAKAIPAGRPGLVVVRVGPGGPQKALIEVEDNGEGMNSEVMRRMFEPFFTTRPVGQGMGLGLSVCHAIITAHGGTIAATSVPGKGSTFRVELPVAAAVAPRGAADSATQGANA